MAGAIIGGVVGHQNDETPEGALIGGAVGAIAGGLLGNAGDRHIENPWQRQADFRQRDAQFREVQAQQISQAVSINDAITLSQSGEGAGVIMNQIQADGVRTRLTVNDIITMSRAGVDESVINA